MVKVKICGITNTDDAVMAVDMGADALGFIFAESPRQVSPETARHIIQNLPPFVRTVGVFVDEDRVSIRDIMGFCRLDMVQLHGSESPAFCGEFTPRAVKAFRLKDASSLSSMESYRGYVRAFLLDTYQEGIAGGTGATFDWALARKTRDFGMPVILSGGLGPSNIRQAVTTVQPYAVDVNSGIEKEPGKKDPALMKALMGQINSINRRMIDE